MTHCRAQARTAKKIAPPLPNWRTTLGHAHAILQYIAAHKISYGEFMRRCTSLFLTGDPLHDFDSHPVHLPASESLFRDSAFDQQSRVAQWDTF